MPSINCARWQQYHHKSCRFRICRLICCLVCGVWTFGSCWMRFGKLYKLRKIHIFPLMFHGDTDQQKQLEWQTNNYGIMVNSDWFHISEGCPTLFPVLHSSEKMGKVREKWAENWSEIEKKDNVSGKCTLFALKTREKFFPFFPNCTCKKSLTHFYVWSFFNPIQSSSRSRLIMF
jgi:hypothetical protein